MLTHLYLRLLGVRVCPLPDVVGAASLLTPSGPVSPFDPSRPRMCNKTSPGHMSCQWAARGHAIIIGGALE